jgi:hypothetical protein
MVPLYLQKLNGEEEKGEGRRREKGGEGREEKEKEGEGRRRKDCPWIVLQCPWRRK